MQLLGTGTRQQSSYKSDCNCPIDCMYRVEVQVVQVVQRMLE